MLEKEYIDETCNYIKEIFSYNRPIVWSWGAHHFRHVEYRNMPALRFEVCGFLHQGDVVVAYNRGADTFEVYCLDSSDSVVKEQEDIYLAELTTVVDSMVENNTSQEEYQTQVLAWGEEIDI